MFLAIPFIDIKEYFRKCENFINQLKLGEDDQNQDEHNIENDQAADQDEEEKDDEDMMARKKNRKF